MLKAILFDLDGVVIDSEPLYVQAEQRLFASYGLDIPPEDWPGFKGLSEQAFFDLVESRYRPRWERSAAIQEGRAIVQEVFGEGLDFMPGFSQLIERIRDRYRLGLVTSTSRALLEFIAGVLPGLRSMFLEVVCSDDVTQTKPHPEPYLVMMGRLGVSPRETVIIEDSINGVRSAKASGALTIALAGSVSIDELAAADRVVQSLFEITRELLASL